MEMFVLSIFTALIVAGLLLDLSLLWPLGAGLILFLCYGVYKGLPLTKLLKLCCQSVWSTRNVYVTLWFIGILTAYWRAAGTIAFIICGVTPFIAPSVFLLLTFWLNSLVSFLIGTSFGTAATLGVICATVGAGMQVNPVLAGGAILSGIYFGDRCSPVSTSALLVAEITHTDFYINMKNMLKSVVVPFALSSGIYLLLGIMTAASSDLPDLYGMFGKEFVLHWSSLLPAALVLLLALLKVPVKVTVCISSLVAAIIFVFVQNQSPSRLLDIALWGYEAQDSHLALMLNGGGIISMLKLTAIILLTSSFSGIFRETGLLDGIKEQLTKLDQAISPFGSTIILSAIMCMLACSQTLGIMMTHQLKQKSEEPDYELALDLENSVVVIAAMIPWCLAAAAPLAIIGVPSKSILCAVFLFLVPLCHLWVKWKRES